RGGMMDIEFIAQYLTLRHAASCESVMHVETQLVLRRAGAERLLAEPDAEKLAGAHRLYTIVMQMIRLATDGSFDPGKAAAGVLRRIASAAGLPDFKLLENVLAEAREDVRSIFERIVGPQAKD